jgi:surface antigen
MTRNIVPVLALAAAVLCSATAGAFNTLFMRDTPMSAMSDEEFAVMESTFYDALDNAADGDTVEWGDAAGANGLITPGKRFEMNGLDCREAAYHNRAGGFEGKGTMRFCKDTDGAWKIVP